MNLKQMLKKMKQDSVTYQEHILEYICTVQVMFCSCIFFFFLLHMIARCILDFHTFHEVNIAIWVSVVQVILSMLWYFLFKYYLPTHKQYILYAAYLNIFIITLLMELQYFLYDEFMSYTIIICIILSTSLTVIGHISGYMSIMTLIVALDVATTVFKNYQIITDYNMWIYIIDNVFLIMFVVGINFVFTRLKCEEFAKTQQILYLSEQDGLTSLLNRRALEYCVEAHAYDDALCAMILLDLDNFKALNDTLGHCAGDVCLRDVADELKEIFDETDYVSRLGGDEFMIFMPKLPNKNHAIEKAEQILKIIPRKYDYDKGEIYITCSIGIAFSQSDGNPLYEEFYKCADIAMYTSKEKGKNTITIYTPDLDVSVI